MTAPFNLLGVVLVTSERILIIVAFYIGSKTIVEML